MAKNTQFSSLIRTGFGLGIGSIFATIIFIVIGLAFFIPGFMLVVKEIKNEKKGLEVNNTRKVWGYILMVIGMIFGMGMGLYGFLGVVAFDV